MSDRTEEQSSESGALRRVDLAVTRIDAWSAMKVSFLLSVALGIATVIAAFVIWTMLDGMHVFSDLEDFLRTLSADRFLSLLDYVRLPKMMSYATIIAVVNVVLLTAMSTLGALLYNVVAALVGGIRVALMDE